MIDGNYCVVDQESYACRAVSPLIRNARDSTVLVLVPGGEFGMGDGQGTECPAHRVYLDAYYIGVCCVTNRQYARFVKATGHRAPDKADYGDAVWANGRCPEDRMDHPVVCVSWDDAAAYAKWAGCELPTEAQWERAARGPKGFIYPWGNDWDKKRCRNDKNKGGGQTCAAWEYAAGVSGYGTLNQSGNVWEWCRDLKGDYKTDGVQRNPEGPSTGSTRVYRGGSWNDAGASNGRGAYRDWFAPAYRRDDRGFRLVRTA
jgi:formylglycine-generating enzyme required for sulfatase activity